MNNGFSRQHIEGTFGDAEGDLKFDEVYYKVNNLYLEKQDTAPQLILYQALDFLDTVENNGPRYKKGGVPVDNIDKTMEWGEELILKLEAF